MSDDDKTRKHTTQRPNKHHHHGGGAANPSGGVDLMNPCRLGVGGLVHDFSKDAIKEI
jgi:hypothetical protein